MFIDILEDVGIKLLSPFLFVVYFLFDITSGNQWDSIKIDLNGNVFRVFHRKPVV